MNHNIRLYATFKNRTVQTTTNVLLTLDRQIAYEIDSVVKIVLVG